MARIRPVRCLVYGARSAEKKDPALYFAAWTHCFCAARVAPDRLSGGSQPAGTSYSLRHYLAFLDDPRKQCFIYLFYCWCTLDVFFKAHENARPALTRCFDHYGDLLPLLFDLCLVFFCGFDQRYYFLHCASFPLGPITC